jgi:hypothetical protein
MKKFTFLATAALALVTFTAKAELMDKAFYKMQTFTTIQAADVTPVTAPGTGTNPITVQNLRTNNTPRYLYTNWGEDGWAKAPAELPETGYSFSCKFTIAADAGVSNCLEFCLLPVGYEVQNRHMRLQPTTEYFFRFHQAVNGVDGKDSIWVNGDVQENVDWNHGERVGDEAVLLVGTEYTIRVDVNKEGTEAKSSIIAADGTVAWEGTKDISFLSDSRMGTLWFNTSGACTYKFDDVKLSTLADGPFASEPAVELLACIDTERDYYVKYEEGNALHWILPGEETEAEGSPVYFSDGKMGRNFEEDPDLAGGAWIIECFQSGILKCWTTREEDESKVSDVVETEVVCETIYMPKPSAYISNVAAGFGKTYTLTCDNSETLLRPAVTIHYVLKDAAGSTLAEGNKLAGETVEFTAAGSLDLYAFDNSHPTEWYGRSETETIQNDVEYVLAASNDYQWSKEVCDGTVEGFTRVEIVDNGNKSHWDRIYSTQYYGYDADGNIICSDGTWSADKSEEDVVYWKRGFGFFDKSVIGTDDCKWNVQVPDDIYTGFLPIVPDESDAWELTAWSIFPLEGIVYYHVSANVGKNAKGESGYVPMHIQENYISDNADKPNFYVVHYRAGYDRPDKGDSNFTEVVVAGETYYLYRYDRAINSVEVYTYKGFVAAIEAIENDAPAQQAAPIFNLRGERVENMATPGFYIQGSKKVFVR